MLRLRNGSNARAIDAGPGDARLCPTLQRSFPLAATVFQPRP
jgi:hypothetical protein